MEKYSLFPFLWGFCPAWCLQGINSCFKKDIYFADRKNTMSVKENGKPTGTQLKHSLRSTELLRCYKNKYGQKASSCVHLSQSCWLVVQSMGNFPLGRAGKDPGK